MSEKYYLTKNDGFTYEEMSLYELGRELLNYDGAQIQIDVEFTLMHRKPVGGGNFGHWDEAHGAYKRVSCHFHLDIFQNQEAYQAVREEAEEMLVEQFALEFVTEGNGEGWLNIPDRVRAFDEEGYKEELQSIKENNNESIL